MASDRQGVYRTACDVLQIRSPANVCGLPLKGLAAPSAPRPPSRYRYSVLGDTFSRSATGQIHPALFHLPNDRQLAEGDVEMVGPDVVRVRRQAHGLQYLHRPTERRGARQAAARATAGWSVSRRARRSMAGSVAGPG